MKKAGDNLAGHLFGANHHLSKMPILAFPTNGLLTIFFKILLSVTKNHE